MGFLPILSGLILSPLPIPRTDGGSVVPQGDTLGPFLGISAAHCLVPLTVPLLAGVVPPQGRDMGPDKLNCLPRFTPSGVKVGGGGGGDIKIPLRGRGGG